MAPVDSRDDLLSGIYSVLVRSTSRVPSQKVVYAFLVILSETHLKFKRIYKISLYCDFMFLCI